MRMKRVPSIVLVCNIDTKTLQSFATIFVHNVTTGTYGLHLICSQFLQHVQW